jgi:hypothetical protein
MADISVVYTLTTPGPDITFNHTGIDMFNMLGGDDEYYITNAKGLDMPPLRTPMDNRPQTHGGLVHRFFKGPRHITIEGALMIRSTRIQDSIRTIRNDMEEELRTALESIIDADGTLSWTPQLTAGPDPRSLTVRCEIPLEFDGIELKTFLFGLVAANPDW